MVYFPRNSSGVGDHAGYSYYVGYDVGYCRAEDDVGVCVDDSVAAAAAAESNADAGSCSSHRQPQAMDPPHTSLSGPY